ncbi:MAG: PAS domain S-box protein [Vicinamibacterales bacterium]
MDGTASASGALESLRASELRYRRLFEAARDGILMLDAASGEITAVNPFLANLLGYSQADILGKKLWEISPFDDAKKNTIAFKELQNEEYIRYDDLPLETRDGRKIAVEFVSNIYVSGDERVIHCNIRDITDRKRVDQARATSDERYHTLFDYAPDGIVIADRQSRYLDANPSICTMLGYSRDELIGKHASDIVVAAELEHVEPALASIIGRAGYQREWRFRRKDGTTFSADVIATAMPDGNLLAMIRDVTTRNRVNETLRVTEERMRFALQYAHVGIWDMDYTTGVMRWSDVMESQYGLPPGTFEGSFTAFIGRIHPDDRSTVVQVVENAMKAGTDFYVLSRTIWPDGTVRWLSGAGRILLDSAGRAWRAVGISQDVTERHTMEAQMQQAQKMEAVGRLAGGVAHDFNNLLTVILGFCELLLEGVGPDDARGRDVAEIQKAGLHAASLTRQLLAFSRKQIIEPTLLDLNAILTHLRPMLGRLIREDIKVLFGVRPGLAMISADRSQMEQVVLNLAVNARDAMPKGGTLTIEAANTELDEHYAATHFGVAPGAYVVLTVTDSGSGMTASVRERLFEPFFTTKEVGKGTGLGLATVHGIVARSGGSVGVYSELGRGSSFKVYFPQAAGAGPADRAPAATAAAPTGAETVLVVEDERGLRDLTKRLLVKLGYTVLVAADANEAHLAFLDHPAIALLLTDVVMPGASGPELAEQLLALRPGLKVIYMSGYTDDAIVQHGVLKPGIAFLHKPFSSGGIGRKIREVLDH